MMNAVRTGRVIVMDGAMGTQLQARGLDFARESTCDWNFSHPDDVRAVHRSYVEAGAEVLVTNTFLATDTETRQRGIELARAELPSGGWLLLDIGPTRGLPRSAIEARAALADLPPFDGILLETFSDVEALTIAEAFAGCDVPVVLSITFRRINGVIRSFDDNEPEFFARHAKDSGVSILGVNCGRDMSIDAVAEVVRRYRTTTDLPLMARPNVEAFAGLIEAGATLIGGCCGTTPDFIRRISHLS